MSAEIRFFAPAPFDTVGEVYVVKTSVILFQEDQERKISSAVATTSCIPTASQYGVVARRCALKMYSTG